MVDGPEDYQLTLQHILWRVEHLFGTQEIVSRGPDGRLRYTFSEFAERTRKMATFLRSLDLDPGAAIGSLAWNSRQHLELYLATTALGYTLNTINVRFHPASISYVLKDAGDACLFFDPGLGHLVEKVELPADRRFALSEELDRAVAALDPLEELPLLDEDRPAIVCYTSGTTGKPKGVAYTHRGVFLHASSLMQTDVLGISRSETVMPVVPMFHISAWDVPFASLMAGAKLVLPGPAPAPEHLAGLISGERVTIAIGAPTVWLDLLRHLRTKPSDLSSLKVVVTGGAEPPQVLTRALWERFGIRVFHAWGMTETNAISTINQSGDLRYLSRQGVPLLGCEIEIVDERGDPLPWDGASVGELCISGPWIVNHYTKEGESQVGGDPQESPARRSQRRRWLRTGDMVTVDPNGCVKIVDRKKDLIKSGGEWISSIDLENAIMSHPDVLEAAVVAVSNERLGERPVAVVTMKEDSKDALVPDDIREFLRMQDRFPSWWLPDEVIFVDEIDKTGTGKFDKKAIREKIAGRRRP